MFFSWLNWLWWWDHLLFSFTKVHFWFFTTSCIVLYWEENTVHHQSWSESLLIELIFCYSIKISSINFHRAQVESDLFIFSKKNHTKTTEIKPQPLHRVEWKISALSCGSQFSSISTRKVTRTNDLLQLTRFRFETHNFQFHTLFLARYFSHLAKTGGKNWTLAQTTTYCVCIPTDNWLNRREFEARASSRALWAFVVVFLYFQQIIIHTMSGVECGTLEYDDECFDCFSKKSF